MVTLGVDDKNRRGVFFLYFLIRALPSLVCGTIMMIDDTPAHPEALYDCAVALIHYEEAGPSVSG